MVESIKELRKICQHGRTVKGREGEHWITLRIYRRASIYVTKLLLYTPISATQVSLLGFLIGLAGALLIASGDYWLALAAVALMYAANLLDSVDGEVARYRKQASKKGEIVEGILGSFLHPFYFIGMSFAAYKTIGNAAFFIFGFLACFFNMEYYFSRELTGEYSAKKFHTSPKDSLSRITESPLKLLHFLGTSKHLRDALILLAAVLGMLPELLVYYGIMLPIGYFAMLIEFYFRKEE